MWSPVLLLVACVLAVIGGPLAFHGARPTLIKVSTCDVNQLIASITLANASSDLDTIDMDDGCIYELTGIDNDTDGPNGLPSIISPITINGNGATIARSGATGAPRFRLLHIGGLGTVTLNDLTLRNGHTPDGESGIGGVGDTNGLPGAAIYSLGRLTLRDTTVSDNITGNGGAGGPGGKGGSGGGIYSDGGVLILDNSTVRSNRTGHGDGNTGNGGNGGGIYATACTVTLIGTVVENNSTGNGGNGTGSGQGGDGGGIYVTGSQLEVRGSHFGANTTGNGGNGTAGGPGGNGGGIFSTASDLSIMISTINDNQTGHGYGTYPSSGGSGAGLYLISGMLRLSEGTVSGNFAGDGGGGRSAIASGPGGSGGGIYADSTEISTDNVTFSDNSAGNGGPGRGGGPGGEGGSGGGIFATGSSVALTFATISGNQSGVGGSGNPTGNPGTGSGSFNGAVTGMATLMNTIIANNPVGGNCSGDVAITDYGGNLSYPDATCPGINGDPVLGPLQNNGGPTETMALGQGSAALNAADDAICAGLDQRGIARPQGPHCDIGAFEEFCPDFAPPAAVGVEDILAIAARWGWTHSTPGWDPVYDFNADNRIDMIDIILVTTVWSHTCP